MAVSHKNRVVHLRSLTEEVIEANLEGWSATIRDDLLAAAAWSSDSRQVLLFSEMQLYASVWSLVEQAAVARLESPKLLPPKGMDFSANGQFMALVQKGGVEGKTLISILYASHDWKLTNQFEVAEMHDVQDCKWILRSTAILVQDSALECQFAVYSAMTGAKIAHHRPDSNLGLGIRTISVSPSASLLVCSVYDSAIHIYNNLTQQYVGQLDHCSTITIDPKSQQSQPDIFKEELIRNEGGRA